MTYGSIFQCKHCVFTLQQNYMKLKTELPIRPSEMGVLNIITGTKGSNTPVMLAEKLEVSKPMITAHINKSVP